jgi:Holliday junction resolvasome RuvABC DNA-binding subunit
MPEIIIHSCFLDYINHKNPYAVISKANETGKSIAKWIITELKQKNGQAAFAVIRNGSFDEVIRY